MPQPILEVSRNVHRVPVDIARQPCERWFLLSADHHWDNPKTDQGLIKKVMDEAVKRDALIFVFGDLFCAMQGKWDKRSSKSDIRPEHQNGDYLDALVNTAADFYGRWSKHLALISPGNHCTSILARHETNLIERLVERLRAQHKSQVRAGGYSGWVRFAFSRGVRRSFSKRLFYHHGYGGDDPVTKGAIKTNRMCVYLPDADLVVSGHSHNSLILPLARVRINDADRITQDEQIHVKLPAFKDDYQDGYGGWHVERGGPPKPLGAAWMHVRVSNDEATIDVHRAR